jgi:hypothetical protein
VQAGVPISFIAMFGGPLLALDGLQALAANLARRRW